MGYVDMFKKKLCGWLQENHIELYNSSLKLQKFLFFYECFSKVKGLPYDFSGLKGYLQGPVFSSIYGCYTKEREWFDIEVYNSFHMDLSFQGRVMDDLTVDQAAFLCNIMTESEISEITHHMNIWSAKADRIRAGEKQVPLDESDFNEADTCFVTDLSRMYSRELIDNMYVVPVMNKRFLFSKNDAKDLTDEHRFVLRELVEKCSDELVNPVYAEIDKELGGITIID